MNVRVKTTIVIVATLIIGMVVGALQKEGHIRASWHNRLRMRFEWKSSA